jgi:hypothetical protein
MDLLKYDGHTATVKLHLTELHILSKLRDPDVQDAIQSAGLGISNGRMNNMGIEFESLHQLVTRTEGEPT